MLVGRVEVSETEKGILQTSTEVIWLLTWKSKRKDLASNIYEGQNSFLDVVRWNTFLKDGFLIFCRKSTYLILSLLGNVEQWGRSNDINLPTHVIVVVRMKESLVIKAVWKDLKPSSSTSQINLFTPVKLIFWYGYLCALNSSWLSYGFQNSSWNHNL